MKNDVTFDINLTSYKTILLVQNEKKLYGLRNMSKINFNLKNMPSRELSLYSNALIMMTRVKLLSLSLLMTNKS